MNDRYPELIQYRFSPNNWIDDFYLFSIIFSRPSWSSAWKKSKNIGTWCNFDKLKIRLSHRCCAWTSFQCLNKLSNSRVDFEHVRWKRELMSKRSTRKTKRYNDRYDKDGARTSHGRTGGLCHVFQSILRLPSKPNLRFCSRDRSCMCQFAPSGASRSCARTWAD